MAHIVRVIPYAGWKNCIHITNTVFEAVITAEVGPRIVRFSRVGGPNMLWLDEFAAGQTEETKTWRAYGGHSFDAIVDDEAYLPPENQPVGYELMADGVQFAPVEKDGLSKTIAVRMCRRGGLEIKETITNLGSEPRRVTVNGHTLLRGGGVAAVPFGQEDDVLCGSVCPEIERGERLALIEHDESEPNGFRLHFGLEELWCGYFSQGNLFIMTSPKQEEPCANGVNLSLEASARRFRMSSYSPEKTLQSGESFLHTEVWNIFTGMPSPCCEEEAEAMLKNNKYFYEFCKKPVPCIDD